MCLLARGATTANVPKAAIVSQFWHAAKGQMPRINSAAIVIFALIAGCSTRGIPAQAVTQNGEIRRDFATVTGDVVSPYSGGPAQPAAYHIVKSRQAWEELWRELEPRTSRKQGQTVPNPLPGFDFQRSVLIIAAMGTRPTGGYSVEISSVVETSQRIVVTVAEQSPGSKCVTTQSFTYPIAIATTAQTQKPFEFEFVRTTQQCT